MQLLCQRSFSYNNVIFSHTKGHVPSYSEQFYKREVTKHSLIYPSTLLLIKHTVQQLITIDTTIIINTRLRGFQQLCHGRGEWNLRQKIWRMVVGASWSSDVWLGERDFVSTLPCLIITNGPQNSVPLGLSLSWLGHHLL